MEPEIKKGCFEMAGLRPEGRLTNLVPGYRSGNTTCPYGGIYSPVWPWSCHQQHLPRDPEGAMLALALGNRSADLWSQL